MICGMFLVSIMGLFLHLLLKEHDVIDSYLFSLLPVCPTFCAVYGLVLHLMCSLRFSALRPWTLYQASLSYACAKFPYSTSECFPQNKALLFSSSLVTTMTTVWFLDWTDMLALVDRCEVRGPATQGLGTLHVNNCGGVDKLKYFTFDPELCWSLSSSR